MGRIRNFLRLGWDLLPKKFFTLAAPLVFLLYPQPSHAYWSSPTDIVHGTAYTLPEGRLRIGITSPLSYGMTDRIMFSTHPVLDLLLAPNVGMRFRLNEGPFTVSIGTVYTESFFPGSEEGHRSRLRLFTLGSFPMGDVMILTFTSGWQQGFDFDVESLHGSLTTHVKLGRSDTFMIHAGMSRTLDASATVSGHGIVVYARAFGPYRVGFGAAFGPPLSLAPLGFGEDTQVWPFLDLWRSY